MYARSRGLTGISSHLVTYWKSFSVLLFGILADTLTTIFGLAALETVYETNYLPRVIMDTFGLLPGSILTIPVKITIYVSLALIIQYVYSSLPDAFPRTEHAHKYSPTVVYLSGGIASLYFAVTNLLLPLSAYGMDTILRTAHHML